MAIKKWTQANVNLDNIKTIEEECQIGELNSTILASRGLTTYSQALKFFSKEEVLSDPFDIMDMKLAVNRINDALDNDEKITIYGDYDCDGITSTAVLYTYLNSIGANVTYYIPSREEEGYGLNKNALQKLYDQGSDLVITVDNGISAVDEVKFANEIGLDIIITDHHQPGDELPQAIAVVDPHRKDDTSVFKYLAGCGVVFKLIAGLEDGDYSTVFEQFADIVAIGTIADIVSLEGENRTIVRAGLESIKNTDNFGINALLSVANIDVDKIDSTKIAFGVAPRINATGRIGNPLDAVTLLTSESEEEALVLAHKLDELNATRKDMEAVILDEIDEYIKQKPAILSRRVLILSGVNWHHGIIGIVCSKLVEKYGKPTFVMTADGDYLRGSARSFGDFHLYKSLDYAKEFMGKFGGHKYAAGYSVKSDKFNEFVSKIEEYAAKYHDIMPALEILVDANLTSVPTLEEVQGLTLLEPFGESNPTPIFMIKNCIINNIKSLKEDKHQKLTLQMEDNQTYEAMLFFTKTEDFIYKIGDKVDILVNTQINEFRGDLSVSLLIKDIRKHKFNERKFFASREYYNKIARGDNVDKKVIEIAIPKREEINLIYKYLRENNGTQLDVESLFLKICDDSINYCKFRVILTVLHQAKLIKVNTSLVGVEFIPPTGKVDLQMTPLMQLLKSQL